MKRKGISQKPLNWFLALCVLLSLASILPAAALGLQFPVCTNSSVQQYPAISGNIVVWQDYRNSSADIYGKNLSTGQEFPICTNTANQDCPAISGNIVVWYDYRNGTPDIYGYDLSTSQEFPICTNASDQYYPSISGTVVVWSDYRNGNWDIYGYDISTRLEFPVCTNAAPQAFSAISGDIVVWEDYRNGTPDIYGYDLSRSQEFSICTAAGIQWEPKISGNIVVWVDYRNDYTNIYGYNLSTSQEFPVCTNALGQDTPAVSGTIVVWLDFRHMAIETSNTDIYGYDLSTGQEFPVCTNASDQYYPSISGTVVVWHDYRNNSDIYGSDLHAAPTQLTASAVSTSQINLAWTDNGSFETGYKIERKMGATGTYTQIATVGANVTSYANTDLTAATAYYYRVRAYNGTGDSDFSNEANATTLPNPPAAPLYLGAYAVSPTQINLAWWDASSNETGFKIERKTGATGTWAQIATLGANVTSYANTGLTANTQYYYRACAYNAGGDSAFSNEANATTGALPGPTSLIASAKSTSQITLNWTDNSTNETGFKIERKTGATGTYALIATVGANLVTYSNTGLTVNTTYYYRIYAYNATGNSVYSNIANATPASLPAPSNLRLTAVSNTQINLAWWDNSTTETGFKIERKTGSAGTWAQIATVGANITSYSNTGLAGATTYYYRVRANAGTANSLYSNEPYATTYAVAAPTNLVASIASTTSATLTWTDNATNETGFKIERKTGITGAYAQIATVGANILTYTDTGLAGYTDYYYRVRAYNGSGNSTYSNEAGIVPAIGTPRYLGAYAVSLTQINLAWWDAASNETGFMIERKTGSAGAWAQIATVGANVTSYANISLTAATTYYYRVRAYNASGNSAYSNEAYATTYALNAPTSLVASIATATSAKLTWVDNSTNETGFSIERKTGITGAYAQIATVGANVVTYTNTGLTGYTDYYYRVRAYNASGNSTYSNEVGIAPAIGTPRYLGAYTVSLTQINLAWWDAATNETGFKIERKTGSTGAWAQIATVGANVVSYSNTGLAASTAYYYRVRAYNGSGNSAYSNEASATTLPTVPAAPSSLTATAASNTQINLAWTDNATNETGVKIERKTGASGTYAQIATLGANVTSYADTGLTAVTAYYYRVRAYNASGNSAYSNETNAKTYALATPTGLSAAVVFDPFPTQAIDLSWSDANFFEFGFEIERKTGASGTYAQIATTGMDITTYRNTSLAANTQYYYRVRAYNSIGSSNYSNEANATTPN